MKKHRENETEDREKKRSIAPAAWVSIARSSARPPPAAVAAMAAAFFAEEAGGPLATYYYCFYLQYYYCDQFHYLYFSLSSLLPCYYVLMCILWPSLYYHCWYSYCFYVYQVCCRCYQYYHCCRFCVSIHLPYNAKQASCRRSYFSSVRGGPLKVVVLAVVVLEEVVLEEVVRSLNS